MTVLMNVCARGEREKSERAIRMGEGKESARENGIMNKVD